MSNKDLDEYTNEELSKEIERREICAKQAICHYCNQPLETHICKFSGVRIFECPICRQTVRVRSNEPANRLCSNETVHKGYYIMIEVKQ